MKGLVLLFIVIVFGLTSWSYFSYEVKLMIKQFMSRNFWTVVVGVLAVVVAIVVSVNTTLRLV
jgi:hypothetical protein